MLAGKSRETDAAGADAGRSWQRLKFGLEFGMDVSLDLGERDAEILYQRVVEEASFEEIAATHAISTVNARQRVSRMLKRLRTKFQP